MLSNKAFNRLWAFIFSFLGCSLLFCIFMALLYSVVTPRVGDYYVLKWEQENPFIYHNTNIVLAVKQGHVQYRNQYGIRSDTISNFRICYTCVGSSVEKP
jgi:hypothetical protein